MCAYRGLRPLASRLAVGGWSLRARLLGGAVGLCAIALAVTGTVGVALLRGYLEHQIDRQLDVGVHAISRSSSAGQQPGAGPRPAAADGQLPTPFVFTQLDDSGVVESRTGGLSGNAAAVPDLAGVDKAKVQAENGRAFTAASVGGGSGFRVRAMLQADGAGIVTVAVSLQSVDATIHRMETISWLVALGVLAALAALATVTVRLALRPLRLVEKTAEEIAAGDLSRRIPDGRPGTEIGQLSGTLNGMLGQIESAFADRDHGEATLRQFVADASHELRTPLTTVRGYAELSRTGALADTAAQQHAMQRIEAEATRMGRLVEDLLLLAHLDQHRPLNLAAVDLSALTGDAVGDARVRDPNRPVDYAGPGGAIYVWADADRLRQVLGNLLGNALTHTPTDTAVHVSLTHDGSQACLVVADEGPGLQAEQVARLFERFYRVDPGRSRERGGSGLGLAIVQAIARATAGSVRCISSPGAGTSFVFTLPLEQRG